MATGTGTVSFQTVRETNLRTVLRTVRGLAPCSRAAVAAATGLNKTTVSSLVSDLMARGLVRETGETSQRRVGRPGVLLDLDDRSVAAIGLEVNVDYLSVVAVDLLHRELAHRHVPLDARSAGALDCAHRIADTLREVTEVPELRGRSVVGVSVAVPGLIDAHAHYTFDPTEGSLQAIARRDDEAILVTARRHAALLVSATAVVVIVAVRSEIHETRFGTPRNAIVFAT